MYKCQQCNNIANYTAYATTGKTFTIPKCVCKDTFRPKFWRDSNRFINDNIFDRFPEKCTCECKEDYNKFISQVIQSCEDVIEFAEPQPELPLDGGEIIWRFYACDRCVTIRPWCRHMLTLIE